VRHLDSHRSWSPGLRCEKDQCDPSSAGSGARTGPLLYVLQDWSHGRGGWPGKDQQDGQDKDIRAAVEAELDFDPRVEATDITVKNVNGEVALNGTVPSYPQYLAAAAATRRVAGVTELHNHLPRHSEGRNTPCTDPHPDDFW
jgi:hypothetical protein